VEEPDDSSVGGEDAGGPTARGKAVMLAVVAVVMVATLVLCCVATGQLGALIQLRLPPP
jgi:hypothetical protein